MIHGDGGGGSCLIKEQRSPEPFMDQLSSYQFLANDTSSHMSEVIIMPDLENSGCFLILVVISGDILKKFCDVVKISYECSTLFQYFQSKNSNFNSVSVYGKKTL